MRDVFRHLLRHSLVYGAGQALSSLASFLLLPVYTRHLTTADYGCIALLDLTAGVLSILIGSGMASAVTRFHFAGEQDRHRDQVWWTGLTIVAALASILMGACWLCRDTLAEVTLGQTEGQGAHYYSLILACTWFGTIGQVLRAYLLARKWSGLAVAFSIARLLLNIALNLYFLVVLRRGIEGILTGNLMATVAMTAALAVVFLATRGPYSFGAPIARHLLAFGIPLIGTALLSLVMHEADRYLLRLFVPRSQIGIYSLAYQIGQGVLTLCLVPFVSIWSVLSLEVMDRPDSRAFYAQVHEYFVYGLLMVIFAVSLAIKPILSVAVAGEYVEAANLIPIILLAYFFFCMHEHFKVPVVLAKRTTAFLPVFCGAAMINVAANLVLIPLLGTAGAAWATLLTFMCFSFGGLLLYRRIEKIDYSFRRCALATTGIVLTFLGSSWLDRFLPSTTLKVAVAGGSWFGWAICLFWRPIAYLLTPASGRQGDLIGSCFEDTGQLLPRSIHSKDQSPINL